MYRYSILLLAGLLSVSTLSSCSKPVATEADGVSKGEVFLEDMGNGVCRQLPSGLMWQIERSKKFSTWEEANEYVNRLELGGYNDWRLPTRNECLTFSELLLIKKGDCSIKIKKSHWISDNKKRKPGFWDEYPLCGGSEFRWVKSKEGFVRAVRP
jgi:uncharacterized protein DUF1566